MFTFTFNIIVGVILLVAIFLLPQLRKYLKKKYDFDFSKNPVEIADDNASDDALPQLASKPSTTSANPTVTTDIEPLEVSSTPEHSPHENTPYTSPNETPLDNINPVVDTPPINPPSQKTGVTERVEELPPVKEPVDKPLEPEKPQKIEKPKKAPAKKPAVIDKLTFYVLPKSNPYETIELRGEQILNELLNKEHEGEIRFNEESQCFTHYLKNNSDDKVYDIYQASEPPAFPAEENIKELITAGLMFCINFNTVSMTEPYAYVKFFLATTKRVAEALDYQIYILDESEELQPQDDKQLEQIRKELLQQKNKSHKSDVEQKQSSLF